MGRAEIAGWRWLKSTDFRFPRIVEYQTALARSRSVSAGVAETELATALTKRPFRFSQNASQRDSSGNEKSRFASLSLVLFRSVSSGFRMIPRLVELSLLWPAPKSKITRLARKIPIGSLALNLLQDKGLSLSNRRIKFTFPKIRRT
jgi:hypothetical protein